MPDTPDLRELIEGCSRSADHLEMRDNYSLTDPAYLAWTTDPTVDATPWYQPWIDLVTTTTRRGVMVRRARVVSEPVTDYIRFEHHLTAAVNIVPGEQVRWLPRRHTDGIALPGNDFWLMDGNILLVHYFAGDGHRVDSELVHDPVTVSLCREAFEAVWDRAIPHDTYQPR